MSGSSSPDPVATSRRRAASPCPPASRTRTPARAPARGRGGSRRRRSRAPGPSDRQQLCGWHAVTRQEPLHLRRRGVPWRTGVDHHHLAAGPTQDQRCAQASGSTTDDHHVRRSRSRSFPLRSPPRRACATVSLRQLLLPFSGNWCLSQPVATSEIDAVLADVGPRLRQLRAPTRRDVDRTGCHDRYLQEHPVPPRVGPTQAKPRAVPITQAHRIPLDELVGAPEIGDPRIRLKPQKRNGRVVVPLTRQPQGMHAWKVGHPTRAPCTRAAHA